MWTALNESVWLCFPCMLPNTVTTLARIHSSSSLRSWVETFIKFQQILIPSQTQLIKLKREDLCLLQQQTSLLIVFLIRSTMDSKINQSRSLNKPRELRATGVNTERELPSIQRRKLTIDVLPEKCWVVLVFTWMILSRMENIQKILLNTTRTVADDIWHDIHWICLRD